MKKIITLLLVLTILFISVVPCYAVAPVTVALGSYLSSLGFSAAQGTSIVTSFSTMLLGGGLPEGLLAAAVVAAIISASRALLNKFASSSSGDVVTPDEEQCEYINNFLTSVYTASTSVYTVNGLPVVDFSKNEIPWLETTVEYVWTGSRYDAIINTYNHYNNTRFSTDYTISAGIINQNLIPVATTHEITSVIYSTYNSTLSFPETLYVRYSDPSDASGGEDLYSKLLTTLNWSVPLSSFPVGKIIAPNGNVLYDVDDELSLAANPPHMLVTDVPLNSSGINVEESADGFSVAVSTTQADILGEQSDPDTPNISFLPPIFDFANGGKLKDLIFHYFPDVIATIFVLAIDVVITLWLLRFVLNR